MNQAIKRQIASLDSLFVTADGIKDDEIKAHFARYLCVKVSGLFENYLKSQIGDYADTTSPQPLASFVKSKMRDFTNVDYKKLERFLPTFNNAWWESFNSGLSDEMKSSLNSIISNRNNIAHGNSDSISYRSVTIHYENIKKIMELLDSIIKKQTFPK